MYALLVALAVAVVFCPAPADAKTLYVNNSGSSSCSDATTYAANSVSSPWCTLLRAVRGNSDGNRNTAGVPAQAARAGDTVHVTAGTYDYSGPAYNAGSWLGTFYDPINSGSAGSWITFQAAGTVILAGNRAGRSSMIGSNAAQYIKWRGFTINQAQLSSYAFAGQATTTANNVWFEGNTFIGTYTDYGVHDNHPGILIHGERGGTYCTGEINNITVRNNSISGFTGASSMNDAGITLYCLGANILIENNEIFGNTTGIYAKSNYDDNENITIRNNYIHDNEYAISMKPFSDWHVYQNLIKGNRFGYLFMPTINYVGNPKPNDTYVVNNTMVENTHGIYLRGLCGNFNNNHVKNNIIVGSVNAVVSEDAVCMTPENVNASTMHFNWNIYGHSGSFFGNGGGGQVASFAGWRSNYGQSADSSNGTNPLFANPAAGDFRLQAGSPARNAGRDVLDLDGDGSTTDPITLGAYVSGNEVIGINRFNLRVVDVDP